MAYILTLTGLYGPEFLIIMIFASRKPNIFDNMMAMMEKYANNLEALVNERTDQLVEEKKKTGNIYSTQYILY
jgi:hypothetical protein